MEAVSPLSPYNKQIKAQRNRHSRSVNNLVSAQSTATVSYYPQLETFSDVKKQPPLLPLPSVAPAKAAQQSLNFSPTKKRDHNLTRHQSLITPRKSPPSKSQILQRPDQNAPVGPHPNGLPRVKFMDGSGRSAPPAVEKFFAGESVFMMAPPPSSLPLPKFSLRPKRSCTAEAVAVDACATDCLRRILRLS